MDGRHLVPAPKSHSQSQHDAVIKTQNTSTYWIDDTPISVSIKCICGFASDTRHLVQCETCGTWQHIECYYREAKEVVQTEIHECVTCAPRVIGHGTETFLRDSSLWKKAATSSLTGSESFRSNTSSPPIERRLSSTHRKTSTAPTSDVGSEKGFLSANEDSMNRRKTVFKASMPSIELRLYSGSFQLQDYWWQTMPTLTACSQCRLRNEPCIPGLPLCKPCKKKGTSCEFYNASQGHHIGISPNLAALLWEKVRELQEKEKEKGYKSILFEQEAYPNQKLPGGMIDRAMDASHYYGYTPSQSEVNSPMLIPSIIWDRSRKLTALREYAEDEWTGNYFQMYPFGAKVDDRAAGNHPQVGRPVEPDHLGSTQAESEGDHSTTPRKGDETKRTLGTESPPGASPLFSAADGQREFLFVDAKSSRKLRRHALSFVMQKPRREGAWSTSKRRSTLAITPALTMPTMLLGATDRLCKTEFGTGYAITSHPRCDTSPNGFRIDYGNRKYDTKSSFSELPSTDSVRDSHLALITPEHARASRKWSIGRMVVSRELSGYLTPNAVENSLRRTEADNRKRSIPDTHNIDESRTRTISIVTSQEEEGLTSGLRPGQSAEVHPSATSARDSSLGGERQTELEKLYSLDYGNLKQHDAHRGNGSDATSGKATDDGVTTIQKHRQPEVNVLPLVDNTSRSTAAFFISGSADGPQFMRLREYCKAQNMIQPILRAVAAQFVPTDTWVATIVVDDTEYTSHSWQGALCRDTAVEDAAFVALKCLVKKSLSKLVGSQPKLLHTGIRDTLMELWDDLLDFLLVSRHLTHNDVTTYLETRNGRISPAAAHMSFDATKTYRPGGALKQRQSTFLNDIDCAHCRHQNMSCDRGRPNCQNCHLCGTICEGYWKSWGLFWTGWQVSQIDDQPQRYVGGFDECWSEHERTKMRQDFTTFDSVWNISPDLARLQMFGERNPCTYAEWHTAYLHVSKHFSCIDEIRCPKCLVVLQSDLYPQAHEIPQLAVPQHSVDPYTTGRMSAPTSAGSNTKATQYSTDASNPVQRRAERRAPGSSGNIYTLEEELSGDESLQDASSREETSEDDSSGDRVSNRVGTIGARQRSWTHSLPGSADLFFEGLQEQQRQSRNDMDTNEAVDIPVHTTEMPRTQASRPLLEQSDVYNGNNEGHVCGKTCGPHLFRNEATSESTDWESIRSRQPEDWMWDIEYNTTHSTDEDDQGCWTCTPSDPEVPKHFPLTIFGSPVVIPVEHQWPPGAGVNPPPDPRPSAPIDCTKELRIEVIRDIFLTFEGSIGFYLLINGLLQILVPETFDRNWASSHLPYRFGGLKVSYISQTMKPTATITPGITETTRPQGSQPTQSSSRDRLFRSSRTSGALSSQSLRINDFIEARAKSSHIKDRFAGRIGLKVTKRGEGDTYLIMSTHVITEAILAKSPLSEFLGRRDRFEKLDDDWNEHVEIWAGNEKVSPVKPSPYHQLYLCVTRSAQSTRLLIRMRRPIPTASNMTSLSSSPVIPPAPMTSRVLFKTWAGSAASAGTAFASSLHLSKCFRLHIRIAL